MRYVPTQGVPLPYGLILMRYYRTSPEQVSLRYAVSVLRAAGGRAVEAILIRDIQEGSQTRLPVETLESHRIGEGRIAVENRPEYHEPFTVLQDLFVTQDLDLVLEDGGRYFRVLSLVNEETPLPRAIDLPEGYDPYAEFADEPRDGTGRTAFQHLVDGLGLGIEVVSSRHKYSGFAGTEVYELVLELGGRRAITEGALTGYYGTNGFSLPEMHFDELGRASFVRLQHARSAPLMRVLRSLGADLLDRHNLLSTATEDELRAFAAEVLRFWNSQARPALNAAYGRPRQCNDPFPEI